MHRTTTNILFVSEENGCRSLLAEACLNHLGGGKLRAYSCGVPEQLVEKPFGWTLLALTTAGVPATDLHCKAWTEFTRSGAPTMDFVVALDAATMPLHPAWPGQPITALWDYPHVAGQTRSRHQTGISAVHTLMSLRRRIELLVSLHARSKTSSDLGSDLRDMSHL